MIDCPVVLNALVTCDRVGKCGRELIANGDEEITLNCREMNYNELIIELINAYAKEEEN